MEKKTPSSPKWYETAGIPKDLAAAQMPLLFIRRTGRVEVKNRENGSMLLTGYSNGGRTSYVNFVYRFNTNTKTADLLYFDSSNSTEATASLKTRLDKIEFNKPLPVRSEE